jgi:hypothetical protein
MKTKSVLNLAIIATTIWVAVTIWFVTLKIEFSQNCTGYLQQAADANTIELAIDRLDRAIEYVELNGWTDGYTSILWKTEDDNIGFWYENLKASRTELEEALDASQMERTNVLMKLRETLVETDGDGTYITYPNGLWKYPHNMEFAMLYLVINILLFGAWIYYLIKNTL